MEQKKSTFWKFALGFLGLIILAIALFFGWNIYSFKKGEKAVQDLAEGLKRFEEENYQRAMADTYGGTTPQETLQMYIDAVEAGDYELASKYFVGDYQDLELANLKNSSQAKLNSYIGVLKTPQDIVGAYYSRDYMAGGQEFIVDEPIYIRVRLYPNGVWKILEI